MNPGISRGRRQLLLVLVLLAVLAGAATANAQGRGGQAPAPATAQAAAPKDLTGYWVSVVTEDWRWRMVVPIKGDFASVPLNPEGRKVATAWDPANDKPGDDQCKPYGAASILRVPGRLHITWADANTLRIETDSGTQTRLLHFGGSPPPAGAPQWQGYSDASWEGILKGRRSSGAKGWRRSKRLPESGHHAHASRVLAQEWYSLWRRRDFGRISRSFCRAEWRHLAGSDHRCYRPAVPESAVRNARAIQEDSGRFWVGSHAMPDERSPLIRIAVALPL